MRLRLGERWLELERGRPLLMGVMNATPDSFSDDPASSRSLDARLRLAHELVAAGAALIDVGGESGRTDRPPVGPAAEAERVVPLVRRLSRDGIAVSVDTYEPEVARAALEAGAVMVNDTSGLRDVGMAGVCAAAGAALVVMHTRTAPKVKTFPGYDDVTADVVGFLRERMRLALAAGLPEDALVIDPGPDFAKTPGETVEVLRRLPEVVALGRPVLLAVSRKDFVGAITQRPPRERLAGTLAALAEGVEAGVALLRVHDVREVADFLAVRAALRGDADLPGELPEHLRRSA